MRFFLYIFLSLFTYITFPKNASGQFPHGYFRSPINEKIELSGNFGELRPNHFHTGIDIKICGVEGLPIYAAADGYVSRIGISPVGYGNVLYIAHPNGYTTVYAHLYRFANNISGYVRQVQYQTQSFEQDMMLDAEKFPVKKGDLIGFGGNSGGSHGAHLHFEIRETKTEKPVNPLLFGFDIPDSVSPVIRSVKIYPLEENSYLQVNFSNKKIIKGFEGQSIKLDAVKIKGTYYLKGVSSIKAQGPIGFAIQADDYIQGVHNTLGVYSVELCLNSQRQYFHQMQRLDFSLKRFINTHTDYTERSHSGKWYEKSFIRGNNELPIYSGLQNNGIININGTDEFKFAYYLKDANANLSTLVFNVTPVTAPVDFSQKPTASHTEGTIKIPYSQEYSLSNENFSVKMPKNTLYEDISCQYNVLPKTPKAYSSVHELGSHKIPVHDFYEIAIKADEVPHRLAEKAFIVSQTSGYLGGTMENGWLKTKARTLGKFYIMADTTPPALIPGNIQAAGSNLWKSTGIRFKISDNQSGIKSYKGFIDGKWVLFQYDAKSALIYYFFDEFCPPGKHILEMEITDNRNNIRRWKAEFVR